MTNDSVIDILRGMRNSTDDAMVTADPAIVDTSLNIDKVISPILYVFGFPGNIMSCVVWLQPRMRHSSGIYLAALGYADFLFLIIHVLFELYKVWDIKMFDHPVVCELLPVVYMATQYLSPLLVLAFTVERFIGVCFPAKRQTFCTQFRAKIVSAGLTCLSLALGSMQGYFYVYNRNYKYCGLRPEAVHGGTVSVWSIWTWTTEMLVFMCVPLLILIFNILIIRQVKRLSEFESSCKSRPQTTTFSLLLVSFYFIVTTFPVSIVYAIRYYFMPSEDTTVDVNVTAKYLLAKTIIEEIGITHFACKFYIFLVAERLFREEFVKVVGKIFLIHRRKNKMGYVLQTTPTVQTEWNETEMMSQNNTEEMAAE